MSICASLMSNIYRRRKVEWKYVLTQRPLFLHVRASILECGQVVKFESSYDISRLTRHHGNLRKLHVPLSTRDNSVRLRIQSVTNSESVGTPEDVGFRRSQRTRGALRRRIQIRSSCMQLRRTCTDVYTLPPIFPQYSYPFLFTYLLPTYRKSTITIFCSSNYDKSICRYVLNVYFLAS